MTTTNDTALTSAALKVTKKDVPLGQRLALLPPEELNQGVADAMDKLLALTTSDKLSPELRQRVQDLADIASTQKPGMEETTTTWRVPRVNIAQPTTQSEAKPEAARQGDLYTTSGQLLTRPLAIIPIYFHEENINFPKNEKIPACYSPDGKLGSPFGECQKCIHLPFGKQNKGKEEQKTDCSNNIVCVALTEDLSSVVLIQFGKTSRKAGSVLQGLAGQQTFVWRQSYLLETEKKTGDLGVYFIYKVAPTGKDNSPGVQEIAKALYVLYSAERQRALRDHYVRQMSAPQEAAQAEGAFSGGALDAALDISEPDLSTPPEAPPPSPGARPAGKGSGARSSAKPM